MFTLRRPLFGGLENGDIILIILILVGLIVLIQVSSFLYRKIRKAISSNKDSTPEISDPE